MIVIPQKQLDSFLQGKKIILQFFAALFLLLSFFLSSVFATENTVYIKGLGAVLREQPSIQSKKTFKLSRGTKVLSIESKGIWQKVESGVSQGWLLRGQISKFPVKKENADFSTKNSTPVCIRTQGTLTHLFGGSWSKGISGQQR